MNNINPKVIEILKKEKINKDIYYYLGASWKLTIDKGKYNFKNNYSYVVWLYKFIDFIKNTNNQIFIEYLKKYNSSKWDILNTHFNDFDRYITQTDISFDEEYVKNQVQNYLNNINTYLNQLTFFTPKSYLYQQIKQAQINDYEKLYGFILHYRIEQWGELNSKQISGLIKAKTINNSLDIATPSKDFKDVLEEHRKRDLEIDEKINIFNQTKANFDKESKLIIKNFNKEFSDIKQNLENEKNKLMLSGPIQILYKRLEDYTGYEYTQKNKNNFIYEKSDKRKLWWGKAQVSKFMVFSIIWAILGFALIFATLFALANLSPSFTNNKMIVIISVISSFLLFIYGYILKILIKNWNSAKHISESIQERISLSQFYLSLLQQKNIDEKTKVFAIKSIFKTIDSGMIKETSSNKIVDFIHKL